MHIHRKLYWGVLGLVSFITLFKIFVILLIFILFSNDKTKTTQAEETQTWPSWASWVKDTITGGTTGSLTISTNSSTGVINLRAETLATQRHSTSAVWDSQNNKAYIFGGHNLTGPAYYDQIYEYTPPTNSDTTGSLTTKSSVLPTAKSGTSSVINPNTRKAYIFGGNISGGFASNTIYEYDIQTDTITTKSNLPLNIRMSSAVWDSQNNKAYIFGGEVSDLTMSDKIIEYDPTTDTVTQKAETLPYVSAGTSAVWDSQNNKAYIFGGVGGLNKILEYVPNTGSVSEKAETLPYNLSSTSAVWDSQNNKAYIYGGASTLSVGVTSYNYVLQYIPTTGSITARTETLTTDRSNTSAIWNTSTNKAYIFGGASSGNQTLSTILEHASAYNSAGTSYVNFSSIQTSLWNSLTKAETLNSQTITYYGASDTDASCPTVPAVGDAGTASNWTNAGWSALSFSSNISTLTSFDRTQYFCIGVYMATADTSVTPSIESLTLSYSPVSITLTAPTTGSCYLIGTGDTIPGCANTTVGSTGSVAWTKEGDIAGDTVKVEYSTNNGSSYTTASAGASSTSPYTLTLPSSKTSTAMVRITLQTSGGTALDTETSGAFTIHTNTTPESPTITGP